MVVTGGLGFIGSHVVEDLMKRGANVDVVDNSHLRSYLFSKKLSDYKSV